MNSVALQRKQIAATATSKQAVATQTESSVWVSASAGTGKTFVLTNRIIKLLLNDTTLKPSQILALTFTKAASQEMANRIRERLSEWALADETELNNKLTQLLEATPTAEQTVRAKQLFQLVLTDPVSVNTIHSFCQKILAIFPLEANISPNFKLMDETESNNLIEQATKTVIKNHSIGKAEPTWAFELYLSNYAESTFADNINNFVKGFHRFQRLFNYNEGLEGTLQSLAKELSVNIDLTPKSAIQTKINYINQACSTNQLQKLAENTLKAGKRAADLKSDIDTFLIEQTETTFNKLHSHFMGTSGKAKTAKYVFGKVAEEQAFIEDLFLDCQLNITQAMNNCKSVDSYLLTKAYLHIGWDVIQGYNTLKANCGNLDFDDLISKTASLLQNESQAEWVRYKMDNNITHVLLDEAQDTDSSQWQIVKAIVDEFFNGTDNTQNRTFFAVGDIKQSIYRFRGAEPQVFAEMREYLTNHQNGGYKFNIAELQTSFRSSEPILQFVDQVFANEERAKAVDNLASNIKHQAYNVGSNGKVEIWPLIELPKEEKVEIEKEDSETDKSDFKWQLPKLNNNQQQTTATLLAGKTANSIKELLNSNTVLATTEELVKPADIMILLRNRTIMPEIIAALDKHAIPHSGADEIDLHNDQICEDIINLLKFIANPNDDLSLASTLRSPMFAFTDDELLSLATSKNNGSLWGKLFSNTEFAETKQVLITLLNSILPPYDLIIKALELTEAKGKYICRMANNSTSTATTLVRIEESINAFLNSALTWSKANGGTLDTFIHNFLTTPQKVKRELSNTGNCVRLMTAHKSKGLESPVVYLPDTNRDILKSKDSDIWQTEEDGKDTLFLHGRSQNLAPRLEKQLKEAEKSRMESDELRLLYVAITRAKEQLYIGGITGDNTSWYSHISDAIAGNKSWKTINGNLTFEQTQQKVEIKQAQSVPLDVIEESLPSWATTTAPTEMAKIIEMASNALRQKEAIKNLANPRVNKFNKGKIVHRLLEVLPNYPANQRNEKGNTFLNAAATEFSKPKQQHMLNSVINIINKYPNLFGENSKAEVSVSASFGNKIIEGIIDRLIVENDIVTIIDYKTNSQVPPIGEVPAEYKKQMSLYTKAIQAIYPNKIIKTKILWTSSDDLRLEDVIV